MLKPSVELQEEDNMSESRILFQEVMVDNQPTQQQVIERAEQLEIDDLVLARQSLTKELQSFWRPYMNRYGDIYYINLKQRKAYIDHPIDMETKILYAKRHKTHMPKFRSYQFDDISNSVQLIQDQIKKWQKGELLRSTQTIPSQLNIVYEESQESNTQRQNSLQEEFSQDQYIENLQKSQQENTRSRKSTPREEKQSFNRVYKKFPIAQENAIEYLSSVDDDETQLTPQYQRLLLQLEEQLKKQNQKQLHTYRQKKQQNYVKKEDMHRQSVKAKAEQHKFNLLSEFQSEIEEKNSQNFQKQKLKVILQYKQKLQDFQKTLQKQKVILQKLHETAQSKEAFIQSLQEKMQRRLNQGKYQKSESINKEIYETFFLSAINELNIKQQQEFKKDSYKLMNMKLSNLVRQKGIYNKKNQKVHPSSLTSFYQGIVKKEFEKIDKFLVQNEISRQMRKRTKSIFKKHALPQQVESHIVFAISQEHREKDNQKQNNFNSENITLKKKQQIVDQIENDLLKLSQNNSQYYQRRNKIFGVAQSTNIKTQKQNSQAKVQKRPLIQSKQLISFSTNNFVNSHRVNVLDRRSMYLRMMKRIL